MGSTTASGSGRRTDGHGRINRRRRRNSDRLTAEPAVTMTAGEELTVENSDAYVLQLCSRPFASTALRDRLITELAAGQTKPRMGSLRD